MVLSWLFGGTAVPAEQPKTPPQASETKQASPAPVAIADSEIIPRADQTVKSLQKIRSEVAVDSTLRSIQTDFAAFAEKSDRRRESDAEAMSNLRSVQRLNEILRDWSLERSQLDEWGGALARRSEVLAAHEKDIERIIQTWRATQAAVAKKFLFKAVLQRRVEEVLREAQATQLVVQEQTTRLLKLQSQLADKLAALAEIRKEIDQAREELGRSLFALDSPPLWEALFFSEAGDIMAQAAESARRVNDDLQQFLQTYRGRILLHLVLFVLLAGWLFFLRRGLTLEAVERLGDSSAMLVLERPFSTTLLLALITVPVLYPEAPSAALRIVILPSVIPIVRLLPRLLPETLRHWVYLFAVMYVLDLFRSLLPGDWLLTRLLLLMIAAGGSVGLGMFLRLRGAELSAKGSRERLLLLALRLATLLFAASLVSNFAGNMTLADVLTATPLRVLYAGAAIFAGAHLLMTLTGVALQSRPARWLRSLREYNELIASRCRALIQVAAILFWAGFCLYTVGVLGDVSAAGADFLQLRWKVGAAEISIQDVAMFFAVLAGAVIFSRMLRFVLSEEIFPRIRLPRGVPRAVEVLSRYTILLLGFFIALAAAGVDLSKVTLLISALGVGIGFGLQSVVNNFVSGLILVFERPVQVGDCVEVGTIFGEVSKIGFRASVLRTPDGADVIVPNSELIGSRVVNWSLSDRLRRISIPVSVAYGSDPNRVIEILLGIARKHPAVLAEPEPVGVFDRFGDSALHFTLLCWSSVDMFFVTRSELTIAINNAFKEAGVQIPFPQQDVHVHWADGPGAAAEPSEPLKDAAQSESAERSVLLTAQGPLAKSK
jgi:small-conductance mechanosensitive channel